MSLDPHSILKQYWGFEKFRTPQFEIIKSILDKKDTLAILPTGGGKSLCYQIPAMCLSHCTIVVTPLIALMQNQVHNLKDRNIAADYIHSGLMSFEIDRIIDNARNQGIKLLYISPERLTQEKFIQRLCTINIQLIAVDEAHCISQWGHDFRPSYLNIRLIRQYIECPILAVTATATPKVKDEIIEFLQLKDYNEFILSSARTNLSLSLRREENKIDQLKFVLSRFKRSGLIYSRNRRISVEIAEQLKHYGLKVESYHAGMNSELRKKNQDLWMNNKIQFMSCTTAFGMGIDKSDVDLIVHIELAASLEEYYQEAGRAGRGGQKCYALTLYNERDTRRLKKIIENTFPSLEHVQYVYKCLCHYLDQAEGSKMEYSVDFDIEEFSILYKLNKETTISSIKLLVQAGWLFTNPAFHLASKVRIIASNEELQNIYQSNNIQKTILICLLRNYEGITSLPVNIQEKNIAFELKISAIELTKNLKLLQADGILEYIPHREKPQIQILNERISSKNIKLDVEWIQDRKAILESQINAVLQYAELTTCRQKFILEYFGEKNSANCGICDNCLALKKNSIPEDIKPKWITDVLNLCNKNPKGILIRSIYQYFPSNKQHWIDQILLQLIGEEKLIRQMDSVRIKTDYD